MTAPLPPPDYIYHDSDEVGGDDLYEFAVSGAVDIDPMYEGGRCAMCKRLWTEEKVKFAVRQALERAAQKYAGQRLVDGSRISEELRAMIEEYR